MNSKILIICILQLIVFCSINSLNLKTNQNTIQNVYYTENLITNGDFSNPSTNGGWKYFDEIPGWNSKDKIEIGASILYNTKWTTGQYQATQVAELDSDKNVEMWTEVELKKPSNCKFEFNYGARTSTSLDSQGIRVSIDGDLLKTIPAEDLEIHNFEHQLKLEEGVHKFSFEGIGKSNRLGSTISNVSLRCEKEYEEIQPVEPVEPVEPEEEIVTMQSINEDELC